MNRLKVMIAVLFIASAVNSCAPGYNSVLFSTKSNIGIDLDSEPPTLEVAISRNEGVVEPVFEGGQTLPVMSSFSASTGTFKNFFFGVGATFSTGEAAYVMSYLYSDQDFPRNEKVPYERVTLTREPQLPLGLTYLKPGEVRPLSFGTETVLGLKIAWSGRTAQYPSAVKLGFNRKEVAWVPVALGPKEGNASQFTADIPALLATIDNDVKVEGLEAALKHLQYFATGSAATNLANRRAVREAMLKRTDPENISAFENVARTDSSLELQALLINAELHNEKDAQIANIKGWMAKNGLEKYSWKDLVYDIRLEDERKSYLETVTVPK